MACEFPRGRIFPKSQGRLLLVRIRMGTPLDAEIEAIIRSAISRHLEGQKYGGD